jgi:hypothetical protein
LSDLLYYVKISRPIVLNVLTTQLAVLVNNL